MNNAAAQLSLSFIAKLCSGVHTCHLKHCFLAAERLTINKRRQILPVVEDSDLGSLPHFVPDTALSQ